MTRRIGCRHRCGAWFDRQRHQICGVFGEIGIVGKDRGDRLTNVAHDVLCQDRLLVRLERFEACQTKRNVRDMNNVRMSPHCVDAGQRQRGFGVDRIYFSVWDV